MPSAGVNFDSIGKDILEDLFELQSVASHRRQIRGDGNLHFYAGLGRQHAKRLCAGNEDFPDIQFVTVEGVFAALHLRNIENVIDDREKMTRRIADERCVFDDFLVRQPPLLMLAEQL